MWCRLTFVKFDPEKMDEGRKIFYDLHAPTVKKEKGNIDCYLMESVDEPGEGISFSSWETKEDGDAYEAKGTYKMLVGTIIHTHVREPKLKQYEVKTTKR
jgi:quinol monooxygenase YgiN